MLKLIFALLPLAAGVFGQMGKPAGSQEAPAQASPKVAAKSKPAGPVDGIPAGAVKIDENTYRFVEKDASGKPGKVWLFRRNPFGISKIDEQESAKIGTPLPPHETPASVTDLGDSYRFERAGPFGAKVWTKKKNELTADERTIVDQSGKAATASAQKAAN